MANMACALLAIVGLCVLEEPEDVVLPPLPANQELQLISPPPPEPAPPPPPKEGVLAFRPTSLDFGRLKEGDGGQPLFLYLQNVGDGPLTVPTVTKTGPRLLMNEQCPPVLLPNETCKIGVSVNTENAGVLRDTLLLNEGRTRHQVSIKGTIIAKPAPKPAIVPVAPEPKIVYRPEPEPAPPVISREDLLRDFARMQRYKRTPFRVSAPKGPLVSYDAPQGQLSSSGVIPAALPAAQEWRYHDEDYTGLGIAKTEVSFPVNRCRTITEDTYIDAALENSVNSMIGGRVIAVVSYPVMSSECDYVLIPAGTRIIGEFEPLDENAMTRLEISWRRMILPDGSSIVFDFSSADIEGKSGLQGTIDDRRREKYGTIFAITALNLALYGAAEYFQSLSETSGQAVAQINTDASSQLSDVTASIIQQQLLITNILRLSKRLEILILPNFDLWFPEPELVKGSQ